MPVLGIGGFFFRANDPDALAQWYRTHLGVGGGCAAPGTEAPDAWSWQTLGGPVVFMPSAEGSGAFAADRRWMLNLRVDDLDGLAGLRDADIAFETRAEWDT